jgi:branched-chain amino acid transport system ATP-binding protein
MLLSINNLDVRYGAISALQDVSLQIDHGEIVTLIGANGAGKTTLLRTISGLLRPAGGSIELEPPGEEGARAATPGRAEASPAQKGSAGLCPLHRLAPHQIVRLGVSHAPEGRQIFANLTVRENLVLGAYQQRSHRRIAEAIERCCALFPVLGERRHQRAGTLSGGEQQMLAVGRGLMEEPRVLMIDELSLGLAPVVAQQLFLTLKKLKNEGLTMVLVEQNVHLALALSDYTYVMAEGRVHLEGCAREVAQSEEVRRAYLGL